MNMSQKLGLLSAAALMVLSCSLAGCCGSLCPLKGGSGCSPAVAPVAVDGCSSCAQQSYSTYAQPSYSQGYSTPAYSAPAYSQGNVVNGSFAPSPAAQGLGSGTSSPVFSCLLYTSPSPRDQRGSRMPSSA